MNEDILIWLTSGGGLLAIITAILKHLEGRNLKKKNKELVDNAQSKSIEKLTSGMVEISTTVNKLVTTVDEFSADMKDSKFIKLLATETLTTMHLILDSKECKNSELKQAIFVGQEKYIKFAESILLQNFNVSNKIIQTTAYNLLKSISSNVIISNLGLKRPVEFLDKLQKFLLIQIENFIYEFHSYKNKQNGDRRKDFKISLMTMFRKIVQNSIDLYSNYEQQKTT